jgi:hypothetical protein
MATLKAQVAGRRGKVACDFKKSNRFSKHQPGSSAPTRGVPWKHLTQSAGPKTQPPRWLGGSTESGGTTDTHRTFSAGLGGG